MVTIEKNAAKKLSIDKCLWGYDKYTPEVTLELSYDDEGFSVHFEVFEKNPKRDAKKHFEKVHKDSCLELFLNFSPKTSDRYMNFEVNANGVMNVAFRKDRYEKTLLSLEEVESFNIKAEIFDDYWVLDYKIGFDFLEKYYPEFNIDNCEYLLGNAYKCGDETKIPHYLALFEVGCDKPDFHRPEYFQKFIILK